MTNKKKEKFFNANNSSNLNKDFKLKNSSDQLEDSKDKIDVKKIDVFKSNTKIWIGISSFLLFISLAVSISLPVFFWYWNINLIKDSNNRIYKIQETDILVELKSKMKELSTFNEINLLIENINQNGNWEEYIKLFDIQEKPILNAIKSVNGLFLIENDKINYLLDIIYNENILFNEKTKNIKILLEKKFSNNLEIIDTSILQEAINSVTPALNTPAKLLNWLQEKNQETVLSKVLSPFGDILNNFTVTVDLVTVGSVQKFNIQIIDFNISKFYIFSSPQVKKYQLGNFDIP